LHLSLKSPGLSNPTHHRLERTTNLLAQCLELLPTHHASGSFPLPLPFFPDFAPVVKLLDLGFNLGYLFFAKGSALLNNLVKPIEGLNKLPGRCFYPCAGAPHASLYAAQSCYVLSPGTERPLHIGLVGLSAWPADNMLHPAIARRVALKASSHSPRRCCGSTWGRGWGRRPGHASSTSNCAAQAGIGRGLRNLPASPLTNKADIAIGSPRCLFPLNLLLHHAIPGINHWLIFGALFLIGQCPLSTQAHLLPNPAHDLLLLGRESHAACYGLL
jgi:hypothetical protein